jgi:exportin-2 (importin alpha re-exporter)
MLQIAHSVFKRWRPKFRSDGLFLEIKYVLELFCQPYLALFQVYLILYPLIAASR